MQNYNVSAKNCYYNQERGMFKLLCFLVYMVDIMRKNNVVWGVGRGLVLLVTCYI